MIKKKSLGQHFLRSPGILKKIAEAAEIHAGETVLEIGPGEGTLTRELLASGANVIAIEKDDRLIPILSETFAKEISAGQFKLIHADVLKFDSTVLPEKYILVGNIPYYITGALFKQFLESKRPPQTLVFLIQEEVAQRIIARDGKESILSISVKVYGEPSIVAKVPRGAFVPPPNVDSAILTVKNISKRFFEEIEEKAFFEILRAGFKSKRKMLASNLPFEKAAIERAFASSNLDKKIRPEKLSADDWKKLIQALV